MRLIDADELKQWSEEIEYTFDGGIDINEFDRKLESMPTVEAIPVEWIEEWLDDFLGTKIEEEIDELDEFRKDVYRGVLLMYNEWRREK